jgi:hypothetical protein
LNPCETIQNLALGLEGKTLKAILQVRQNPSTRTRFNQTARKRMATIKKEGKVLARFMKKVKKMLEELNSNTSQNGV